MAYFDFFEEDYDEDEPRRRKPISKLVKQGLYRNQNGKCMYCGRKLALADMHVDHRTPVAANGSDNDKNLQMLCSPCNTRKGDMTDGEFRQAYKSTGLKSIKESKGRPPPRVIALKKFEAVSATRTQRKRRRRTSDDYEDVDWFGGF